MISRDLIKAIQINTIRDVEDETFAQWYSFICRWYSREFSTPLSEVLDMPEETVITVYLEDNLYDKYHSGDENAEQAWLELKYQMSLSDEERETIKENDDAFLEALSKEGNKIKEKEIKSTTKDSEPAEDPNLMREESFQLSGEGIDQLPDFIGE